jgi:hypothetical protein
MPVSRHSINGGVLITPTANRSLAKLGDPGLAPRVTLLTEEDPAKDQSRPHHRWEVILMDSVTHRLGNPTIGSSLPGIGTTQLLSFRNLRSGLLTRSQHLHYCSRFVQLRRVR